MTNPAIGWGEALLPLGVMLALYGGGAIWLGSSADMLVVVLLCAAAVAGLIARRHGRTWAEIQRTTGQKLASVLPAVLILLAIGMLIGTWVISGTIPFLVYWGIELVSPRFLALTAFLSTAVMSTVTGTSWGSAGTIGVALMGTAAALDAPMGLTAGAVVSGAYFGDKMSPLSDSTNISAIAAEVPIGRHIRHMTYTAVPSFLIATLVYTVVGVNTTAPDAGIPDSARLLLGDLSQVFRLNAVVLVPPAIVMWGMTRGLSPTLAIALSSLVAAVIGIAAQPFHAADAISAAVSGFRVEMVAHAGMAPSELGPAFVRLVERGGLHSMSTTLIVIIAAFLLASGMEVSGAIDLLVNRLLQSARTIFRLVAATMGAGATLIALTSHGGVTALMVGGLFQQAFRERHLAPEVLSRSIEDSVTIAEPMMPWTVSAVFMATTLGVPTAAYAPWAVFCYGGPIFSLLLAALFRRTGYGLRRLDVG